MKKILSILLYLLSLSASATNYYVKNGGNDALAGTSDANAWETVTKVNSVWNAGTLAPGDSILFNRGDEWTGVTLTVRESGTSGHPIVVSAYGSGAKPIISGLTTLSTWIDEGNGIYSKVITSESQTNMVLVDGIQVRMGRYPDAGTNLTYTTVPSSSQITDPEIGNTTDWAGAEIVINKNDWTLDRCGVTNLTANVFTFSNLGTAQTPDANRYYFIQNDLRCVTSTNEWYHDYSGGKFYIYGDPAAKVVKMATINNCIYNNRYDYITIENLDIQGSILSGIELTTQSDYCIIKNCTIRYCGENGIMSRNHLSNTYDNNTITYCNTAGIYVYGETANYLTITNNLISYCGIIPGGSYDAIPNNGIYVSGVTNTLVQYNNISNIGSAGISFNGNDVEIRNNFINYPCMLLDDGAGIYTGGSTWTGRIIDGNIILNSGVGNSNSDLAEGIFCDENAAFITISNNVIANCKDSGIKFHKASRNTVTNNLCYNNYTGIYFHASVASTIYDNVMNYNKFIAKSATQIALRASSVANDIDDFLSSADYNYYARPIDDDEVFNTNQPSTGTIYRTLEGWQSFTGQDLNSLGSPVSVASEDDIHFIYNETSAIKYYTVSAAMVDVANTSYSGIISLYPWESLVLLGVGTVEELTQKYYLFHEGKLVTSGGLPVKIE